ncbi:hypothetical protein Vretimale_5193 [Volvox reticuliferus]|uniref:Uncharacterized protein n=1 Tax=Volvox reticuliferus TaxID=1737510 RepID=A0A8J4G5K1_9CHLO|nr:hypothetical protein Vretimale_5193 [Volvox reticuliferus]
MRLSMRTEESGAPPPPLPPPTAKPVTVSHGAAAFDTCNTASIPGDDDDSFDRCDSPADRKPDPDAVVNSVTDVPTFIGEAAPSAGVFSSAGGVRMRVRTSPRGPPGRSRSPNGSSRRTHLSRLTGRGRNERGTGLMDFRECGKGKREEKRR